MDLPASLLDCLCGDKNPHSDSPYHHNYTPITEKPPLTSLPSATNHDLPVKNSARAPTDHDDDDNDDNDSNDSNDNDKLTTQTTTILAILLRAAAPKPGTNLGPQVAAQVSTTDWTSYLAERLLHALEDTLKAGADNNYAGWGEALTDAYNHAVQFAKQELAELWQYAQDHPYEVAASVVLTLLALGVLARLVPAFVRVLGFGRLGPAEGSFAAWWQRLYGGYVPKGSLWSFLQRMGMTWE